MDTDEYNSTMSYLQNPYSSFILLCTNIIESSVTIPNISLILDLCVFYHKNGNRLELKFCDKSALIQRAGRTGRTCHGSVIRLISYDHFQLLPDIHNTLYSWEKTILFLKSHNLDPVSILGHHETISPIHYLISNGILTSDGSIQSSIYSLFLNSFMDIHHTLLIQKIPKNSPSFDHLLLLLIISLLHIMDTQNISFFYIPHQSRHLVLRKIIKVFPHQYDKLIILLSLFITLFSQHNIVEFATSFSLNFKSFRIWKKTFEAILRNFYPVYDINWLTLFQDSMNLNQYVQYKIYYLSTTQASIISRFFYQYTNYQIIPMYYTFDYILDSKMIFPFFPNSKDSICILHSKSINTLSKPIISLYVLPYHLQCQHQQIKDGLKKYIRSQKQKDFNKILFNKVISEISHLVSYRPPLYNMQHTIQEWNHYLQNQKFSLNEKYKL
jgi:hypothetical protein